MPAYSHSRLSTFEQCRLKYKYRYVDRIKREEDSIEAFLGSRFHDVMEKVYAERVFWKPGVEDLKNYFNELWKKNWGDHVFVVRNDRTPGDYQQIGLKAIEDYHKRHAPFQEGRVLGIERRVAAELDGGHSVFGFIDRLMEVEDGHYEIHDYKTSGSLPEQSYFDADRQLALYEIAVRKMWPNEVKSVDLVWHYVVFDREMRSKRTPEQLEELKKSTIALIGEIERTGEFPPFETNLCRWCDYQDICPLFAHKFKTETLQVNEYLKEDGVSLVNSFASLDAKKKGFNAEIKKIDAEQDKIKEAVLTVAEKEGVNRLYGSDKMVTVKDDIKVNYPKSGDPARTEFAIKMNELALWDVVTDVSWSALKRTAKDAKWVDGVPAGLKEFVSVEQYKKLTLSNRKDRGEE